MLSSRSATLRGGDEVGSHSACAQYLATLLADAPKTAFVELRFRTDSGMGRAFYGVDNAQTIALAIARLARHTDAYVGVIPRRRQASSRGDLVHRASVLWADCDTPESATALSGFSPAPSMVVASGTGDNRHAYWRLRESLAIDVIETANRRLAWLLGADAVCADAARILRPPSRNYKTDPATDVRLLRCDVDARHRLEEIVGVIKADDTNVGLAHASRGAVADDPLLRIEPAEYVARLAGLQVSRSGKVRCPFHDDDAPSLHIYGDPQRGWYCYGCGRGGSVYDFASLLWGVATRGSAFVAMRRDLTALLLA